MIRAHWLQSAENMGCDKLVSIKHGSCLRHCWHFVKCHETNLLSTCSLAKSLACLKNRHVGRTELLSRTWNLIIAVYRCLSAMHMSCNNRSTNLVLHWSGRLRAWIRTIVNEDSCSYSRYQLACTSTSKKKKVAKQLDHCQPPQRMGGRSKLRRCLLISGSQDFATRLKINRKGPAFLVTAKYIPPSYRTKFSNGSQISKF
jgi:hypothetical protein